MSWLVQPRLINDPFSDPGLFVDFRHGRRALLFDLGDLAPLANRELMRVSHAFVSHAHMDHFAGFDRLLRVCLHRPEPLHLVGPPGFIERVEHRIRSYTWNLLGTESVDFRLMVDEFDGERLSRCAVFPAREAFARREGDATERATGVATGMVWDEEAFRIEATLLDHGTPSLAFALRETMRVSVWGGALERLGLTPGPWIAEAKRAIRRRNAGGNAVTIAPEMAPDTTVDIPGHGRVPLRQLETDVFRVGPGQRIGYVVDCAPIPANIERIVGLVAGVDILYIEAPFLDADAAVAAARKHLTAGAAGRIARAAGAKRLVPLHFSARYRDRPDALAREAEAAFRGLSEGEIAAIG